MFRWLCRCLPVFNIVLFSIVLFFAFTDADQLTSRLPFIRDVWASPSKTEPEHTELPSSAAPKLSQRIFIYYAVLVHIDTVAFSLRLCLALLRVKSRIQKLVLRRERTSLTVLDGSPHTRSSLPPCYSDAMFDDDMPVPSPREVEPNSEVVHAIILPNYAEDMETLTTTLRVLASHPRALTQYEIYLAMEQKEQGSEYKGRALQAAFEDKFLSIRLTLHPVGLPGEVAGKGSNVAWAARQISQAHQLDKSKGDVLITVIDSDTHLAQDYFNEIRRTHHRHPESANALYVCPIIFDRNAHDVPIFVRVADILWGCAGLAGFLPGASILIPTSVYTLPLLLADDVGGWDGDATAIGEDMHMTIKAYFNSGGRLVTLPIYSPASQCNVSSGRPRGWYRFVDNLNARWKQALRHMWGSLDVGYALRRMIKLRIFRLAHLPLFHLLWEAHIVPVHFIMIIIASGIYTYVTPAELIHPSMRWALAFTDMARFVGFLCMQIAFTLYSSYHSVCVNQRSADMARAGITESFAYRHSWTGKYLLDRITFPIAGVLFGALPALYAQFAHLFTDKLTYGVSVKPLLNVLV